MFDTKHVWDIIINISVAVFGGLARVLSIKDKEEVKARKILSELLISAFIGSMFLMLANELNLSGSITGMVCGMAGWVGPKMLDIIIEFLKSLSQLKLSVKKNEDQNKDDT